MKCLFAVFTLLVCPLVAQNSATADEAPTAPELSDTLGTAELLLLTQPGVIPSAFDFGQIARQKRPVFSLEGMSWTVSRFTVEGMSANDPYQPGHPVALPDPGGVSEVRLFGAAPTLAYTFRMPGS